MTAKPPSDKSAARKPPPKIPVSEEKLAAALRENLRRRKAQAQARATGAAPDKDPRAGGPATKTERDEPS